MGEVRNYESEQEFIDDTEETYGTFHRIDSDERLITMFIPHQNLDMLVYNPFIASGADRDRRFVIISWKSASVDEGIEERLREYAESLIVIDWRICRWPRAEGGVRIGDLRLKNTHHRLLMIRYM